MSYSKAWSTAFIYKSAFLTHPCVSQTSNLTAYVDKKIESRKHILRSDLVKAGVEAKGLSTAQLGVKPLPFHFKV